MAYVEYSSLENQEEEIKESHNSPKRDDVTANGDEETSEQQKLLVKYLDEIENFYPEGSIQKLKQDDEFFFLVQMFVDNQLIDVETIIDMFQQSSFEECYESLTKFC